MYLYVIFSCHKFINSSNHKWNRNLWWNILFVSYLSYSEPGTGVHHRYSDNKIHSSVWCDQHSQDFALMPTLTVCQWKSALKRARAIEKELLCCQLSVNIDPVINLMHYLSYSLISTEILVPPLSYRQLNSWFSPRGHWHQKNIYGVEFFAKAFSSGLTNYIIRHNSLYGNMSSLPRVLCPRSSRSLASLTNPLRWSLFKGYTLKVILNNIVSHQFHLSNAEL